jgi:hypothetical protein
MLSPGQGHGQTRASRDGYHNGEQQHTSNASQIKRATASKTASNGKGKSAKAVRRRTTRQHSGAEVKSNQSSNDKRGQKTKENQTRYQTSHHTRHPRQPRQSQQRNDRQQHSTRAVTQELRRRTNTRSIQEVSYIESQC